MSPRAQQDTPELLKAEPRKLGSMDLHWHPDNPYGERCVYVDLEALAACASNLNQPITLANGAVALMTKELMIKEWRGANEKLDAYVLLLHERFSGGVRYGSDGSEYLSGMFNQAKMRELWEAYHQKAELEKSLSPGAAKPRAVKL